MIIKFIVQPALFCVENPVLSCLLKIKLHEVRNTIEASLSANETCAVLGPLTGLVTDRKYVYQATAFNAIGNTTSAMSEKCLS